MLPIPAGETLCAEHGGMCPQCRKSPASNGTFWCSADCMATWTSAYSQNPGPWPTPGYTESAYAGSRTTAPPPQLETWLGPPGPVR